MQFAFPAIFCKEILPVEETRVQPKRTCTFLRRLVLDVSTDQASDSSEEDDEDPAEPSVTEGAEPCAVETDDDEICLEEEESPCILTSSLQPAHPSSDQSSRHQHASSSSSNPSNHMPNLSNAPSLTPHSVTIEQPTFRHALKRAAENEAKSTTIHKTKQTKRSLPVPISSNQKINKPPLKQDVPLQLPSKQTSLPKEKPHVIYPTSSSNFPSCVRVLCPPGKTPVHFTLFDKNDNLIRACMNLKSWQSLPDDGSYWLATFFPL